MGLWCPTARARAAIGTLGLVAPSGRQENVRALAVTTDITARTTLSRVDYADAFVVDTGDAQGLTGEQWARAVLEGAPPETRRALRSGWAGLGLDLGSTRDPGRVLGWAISRRSADFVLLRARSRLGLLGEVLFERRPGSLLVATFVEARNPLARAVWAVVAPRHRRVVMSLLGHAARRQRAQR